MVAAAVVVSGCSGQVMDSGASGSGPNGIDPGASPRPGQVNPDGASAFDQSPSTALHRLSRRDLLAKLMAIPEGTGSLLDHTAAVFCMEGGKGGRVADGGDDKNHSTDHMNSMVAGRAGGLVPGQHIVLNDDHMGVVFNSAMRAIGLSQALGEISGHVEALFTGP